MNLIHRCAAGAVVFALALPVMAADSAYRVDIGTSTQDGGLRIQPHVFGPAGKALRYEMNVRRAAGAGKANISQSGTVRLDSDGKGALSSSAVTLAPGERYDMTVRLFDGSRLVAEQTASRP